MKNEIKKLIENEMIRVSNHLDNNKMDSFYFNNIYEDAVRNGLFKNKTDAAFWCSANNKWFSMVTKQLNKTYKLYFHGLIR